MTKSLSRNRRCANSLTQALRRAPATVPALAALVLFLVWSTDQAGYPVTHWAPGGLIVLALIGLTVVSLPLRWSEIPVPVRIATGALALYTALSFLSILWAGSPGDAWEGADRTLLYLLVFVLFALWPQRGASAVLLLGVWTLATIGLGLFVLLHVEGGDLTRLFAGTRLAYPSGYPNASAAQWMIAFWPALLLARGRTLPWALRGVFAGGAVMLAELALLSQSRGAFYATPVMLVLVFALLPGRVRTFTVLVPVAGAIALAARVVLRVGDRIEAGGNAHGALHSATVAILLTALLAGALVALWGAVESRGRFSESTAGALRRGTGVVALLALLAVLAGGWAVAGNPIERLEHGWQTFKGGYSADSATGSRLVSGLGSNRYDFYRVALDEFVAHPVLGIGADNFAQQYLRHGHSEETPRYPHSVELRTLTETGLIGGLLAVVGLGAALLAGARAIRGPDPLARLVAAAALAGFAYWAVHGSLDWFFEFAGLGAPAFALLGLLCALTPRVAAGPDTRWQGVLPRRIWLWAGGGLAALLIAASFTGPWLSQLQLQSAARVWTRSPAQAYARLDDAAKLDPLADGAYLVAGSIALRLEEIDRADHEFSLALQRVPGDAYATLERGAIASARGRRGLALKLLERAVALNPRDPLARQALLTTQIGDRVDVNQLNRSILLKAQQIS